MEERTKCRGRVVVCVLAVMLSGSAFAASEPKTDARMSFSAHRDREGLVVDGSADRPMPATRGATVDVAWDRGAIRFTFRSPDGLAFTSAPFERIDGRRTTSVLGRAVATELDVPGVYRAEVRDGNGASVGWLQVSVAPGDVPARRYEADVPAALTRETIGAALARLDADIDWIEAHAADVHVGT